jgi:hypothetical protein
LFITPSSQRLEPPGKRGRFKESCRCQPESVGEGKWRRKRKRGASWAGFGRGSGRAWQRQKRAKIREDTVFRAKKTGRRGRFFLELVVE